MHTVTFGLPFNGVVPLWHEDGLITWHQSDIDLAEVLGLGLVEEREITEGAPAGWSERVGLHRVHMLIVHAMLFGGGYGYETVQVARHYV